MDRPDLLALFHVPASFFPQATMQTMLTHLNALPEFQSLQENYKVLQAELHSVPAWSNWGSDQFDDSGHCMFLDGDWKVCPVYLGNYSLSQFTTVGSGMRSSLLKRRAERLPAAFPQATHLLNDIPSVNFAALTRLRGKSRLAPHKHQNPNSLILHLGLAIPSGGACGLNVNAHTHVWQNAGEAVVFDDNYQHSAWNDSEEDRILLYIDFQRPDGFLHSQEVTRIRTV